MNKHIVDDLDDASNGDDPTPAGSSAAPSFSLDYSETTDHNPDRPGGQTVPIDASDPFLEQQTLGFDPKLLVDQELAEHDDDRYKIGDYIVRGRLGEGGFGYVFLADHPRLGISVALKVARPRRFKRRSDAERFIEEARVAASIRHPGIVTVHDVDFVGGVYFIVQEYLSGGTLADRMKRQPLETELIDRYLVPAAEALAFAHRQGVYHRDIKPANIMFDDEDRPKITDFGLAMRHSARQQSEGVRVGTPQYMSPEQVRGEANRTDGRTDVWALGVILYQMLTGKRPFSGQDAQEIWHNVVHLEPLPPRQVRPGTPLSLQRICMKCLEKLASDRYDSASDLASDLRNSIAELETGSIADSSLPSKRTDTPGAESVSQTPLVPKFLRPYDRHDRDSYLRLLPGPFDLQGLPESIRFWKHWIESNADSDAASVGFLYGPSGSGKSSLLRAGLIPRIDDGSRIVLIESSRDHTEADIAHELDRAHPLMPPMDSLSEKVAWLRETDSPLTTPKTVVVLDQFEQWLHGNEFELATPSAGDLDLIGAMRHADGKSVKFLLVVRDDFSMALNRLCRLIEVRLMAGENFEIVDRFDLRHSRKVLIELGRGYDALPLADGDLTTKHERFFDEALRMLSEGGRVVSIRLSLFAHIVREKDWNESTLRKMGGAEGIGLEFLDETFLRSGGNPKFRLLATPAIRVLSALLPESDDEPARLKGRRRSREELREIAAVDDNDFDDVLEMLDRELGLITPTDAIDIMLSGKDSGWSTALGSDTHPGSHRSQTLQNSSVSKSDHQNDTSVNPDSFTHPIVSAKGPEVDSQAKQTNPSANHHDDESSWATPHRSGSSEVAPQYFQLTHDFLVSTLQRWLTRQRTATRRGRMQLHLERAAEFYERKPQRRRLPSAWEHAQYRLWTSSRDRTQSQRQLLGAALKYHASLATVFAMLIGALVLFQVRQTQSDRINTLVERWAAAAPELYAELAIETEAEGDLAKQRIVARWDSIRQSPLSPAHQSLAFAAANESDSAAEFIRDRIETIPPQWIATLVKRIPIAADMYRGRIESAIEQGDGDELVRWCAVAIQSDPESLNWISESVKGDSKNTGQILIRALCDLPSRECERWGAAMKPAWSALWPAVASSFQASRLPYDLETHKSLFRWPDRQRENLAGVAIQFSTAQPDKLVESLAWGDNANRELLLDELVRRFPVQSLANKATESFDQSLLLGITQVGLKSAVSQNAESGKRIDSELQRQFRNAGGGITQIGGWVASADWDDINTLCESAQRVDLGLESLRPYVSESGIKVAATWSRPALPWTTDQSPFTSVDELLAAQERLLKQGFALADFTRVVSGQEAKWYGLWIRSPDLMSRVLLGDAIQDADQWQALAEQHESLAGSELEVRRYMRWTEQDGQERVAKLFVVRNTSHEDDEDAIDSDENDDGETVIGSTSEETRFSGSLGNLYPGRYLADFRIHRVDVSRPSMQWLSGAIPSYRDGLSSSPSNRKRGYRLRIARMESWADNVEASLEMIERGLADNPDDHDFVFLRAMALADSGDLDRAAEDRERLAELVDADDFLLRTVDLYLAVLNGDEDQVQAMIDSLPEQSFDGHDVYQQGCWFAIQATWYRTRDDAAYRAACQQAVERAKSGGAFEFNYVMADSKWNNVRQSDAFLRWLASRGGERSWNAIWLRRKNCETRLLETSRLDEFARKASVLVQQGFRPSVIEINPKSGSLKPLCCGVFEKPRLDTGWWQLQAINSALLLARLGDHGALGRLLGGHLGPEIRMETIDAFVASGLDTDYALQRLDESLRDATSTSDRDESGQLTEAWLMVLAECAAPNITDAMMQPILDLAQQSDDLGIAMTARALMETWTKQSKIDSIVSLEPLIQPLYGSPTELLDDGGIAVVYAGQWARDPSGGRLHLVQPTDFALIGVPDSDPLYRSAHPQLWTRIPRDYYLGCTEFTRGQFAWLLQDPVFRRFCFGPDDDDDQAIDESSTDRDLPLSRCDFLQAIGVCQRLSELAGVPVDEQCFPGFLDQDLAHWNENPYVMPRNVLERTGYRLPTQAEWEFACRQGQTSSFHFGMSPRWLTRFGTSIHDGKEQATPVAAKWPNGGGFFDMHGNVLEWTIDGVDRSTTRIPMNSVTVVDTGFTRSDLTGRGWKIPVDKKRILRGGSFRQSWKSSHVCYRASADPVNSNVDFGFRIARTAPQD